MIKQSNIYEKFSKQLLKLFQKKYDTGATTFVSAYDGNDLRKHVGDSIYTKNATTFVTVKDSEVIALIEFKDSGTHITSTIMAVQPAHRSTNLIFDMLNEVQTQNAGVWLSSGYIGTTEAIATGRSFVNKILNGDYAARDLHVICTPSEASEDNRISVVADFDDKIMGTQRCELFVKVAE